MKFSRHFSLISLVLISLACNKLPEAEDPPLVQGLPDMEQLTDSLNASGMQSLKWMVTDGQVIHTRPVAIDWKKEFKAFLSTNINRLRYADAYLIEDTMDKNVRTVTFSAKKENQEVRFMQLRIRDGKLIGYDLKKERSNLLSSSVQEFHFSENGYSLNIQQHIDWFFSNEQYVHGALVPAGKLWRAAYMMNGAVMPVQMIVQENRLVVKNGSELLSYIFTGVEDDSLTYHSEQFRSYFRLSEINDSTLKGRWVNEKSTVHQSIPVTLQANVPYRFRVQEVPALQLGGEHLMLFESNNGAHDSTLLVLHQNKHVLTGTVLTPTGDYRWLEGVVRNDSLLLSSMDGTHAYLFEGVIKDGIIEGVFRSGTSWKQAWKAVLNEPFAMKNPETITRLKEGASFSFSFPDENGNLISLSDARFENKVVLVSIMGTWCSNCVDEAVFLNEVRHKYPEDQLEIVALDFELIRDSAIAIANIKRYKRGLSVTYPVLLASLGASKDLASAALPSLNGIYSYPTLILLDREHHLVKIHTGFTGPATGADYYEVFKENFHNSIHQLLSGEK